MRKNPGPVNLPLIGIVIGLCCAEIATAQTPAETAPAAPAPTPVAPTQTPPAPAQTPAPDQASALIDAAKQASGDAAWDKVTSWHERGKVLVGGLTGTYEAWADLPHVHAALIYILGPGSGSQGWDGKTAWTTDSSKQVRIEESDEAVAQAIQDTYRQTYAFFFPDRLTATREDAGKHEADGIAYDAVKITPKGAEPFEIWFDPKTHLIAREVQLTGAMPHSFLFGDYRTVSGVLVPFNMTDRVGDPKFDQVSEISSLELSIPVADSQFGPPPPPAYDAIFPPGKDSVTVSFKLYNNHIYVPASIDGKKPEMFVFDTGATNMFDNGHAKKLGIKVEGALPGGGFGSDISAFGLTKVKQVDIGGMALKDQVFGTNDSAGWIQVEGADSAGLLGYEFVKRAVLTIDYAQRTMTFTKPEAFHPPAGVIPIAFKFDEHIPMVEGKVDGVAGEFEIDTGARSALTLMHPFVEANKLVDRYHASHIATVGYGIGGPSRALLARVGTLAIGPVELKAPVTDMVNDTSGAAAAARTAGNIGGDILKRFTVTLDYGHQFMWLAPNDLADKPDVFDRSGLWISRAADGMIVVADVSSDSAATASGIQVGDEILAVNGQKASGLQIYDLREEFKGAAGTAFTLSLKTKSGAEQEVKLTLADQV